jgi:hypothetical protein
MAINERQPNFLSFPFIRGHVAAFGSRNSFDCFNNVYPKFEVI